MWHVASCVHTEPGLPEPVPRVGREGRSSAPGRAVSQGCWSDRDGRTEEGTDRERRHRLERWKLKAKAKKNPQKMVLLPSTGDKGI